MWIIILLLFIAISLAYFEFIYKSDINRRAGNFRRIKGELPLIGIGLRMFGINNEQLMVILESFYEETCGTFGTWLGPQYIVGIADPDSIRTVLNSNECLDKSYVYKFLHNKTGLFTSDAETWKVHRRALNPTFNHKILLGFIPIINAKSRICVEKLEQHIGCPFDLYRPIYKVVTDILINTALDTKLNMQEKIGDGMFVLLVYSNRLIYSII